MLITHKCFMFYRKLWRNAGEFRITFQIIGTLYICSIIMLDKSCWCSLALSKVQPPKVTRLQAAAQLGKRCGRRIWTPLQFHMTRLIWRALLASFIAYINRRIAMVSFQTRSDLQGVFSFSPSKASKRRTLRQKKSILLCNIINHFVVVGL